MRGRSRPSNTAPRSASVPLMKPNSQIDSAIWVANSFVSAAGKTSSPACLACLGCHTTDQNNQKDKAADFLSAESLEGKQARC